MKICAITVDDPEITEADNTYLTFNVTPIILFIYTTVSCPSHNKMVLNDEPNQVKICINYSLFIQILERKTKLQLNKIYYSVLNQHGNAEKKSKNLEPITS